MADDIIPAQYERWLLAILFAAMFASISWIAPATYLAVTPAENQVQIESVSINQTSNTTHNVTIDYQAQEKYPVEVEITLYQEQNESDVAIETWTTSSVIPEGEHERSLTLDVKEPLDEGIYFYEIDIRIHAGYNVEKEYSYSTDSFPAENSTTAQ